MTVHRIEVRPCREAGDPAGRAAFDNIVASDFDCGLTAIDTSAVYLIEGAFDKAALDRVVQELLAHPATDESVIGVSPPHASAVVEVHPLPGVMDPDATVVESAIESMLKTKDIHLTTQFFIEFVQPLVQVN